MIRGPYHPLTEASVGVAKALLKVSGWSWPSPAMAVFHDGRLQEVRGGAPPQGDALPDLHDPGTVGGLLSQLADTCGDRVCWEVGRDLPFWVRLSSGDHHREWHGQSLGELVSLALIARRSRAGK